MKEGDIYMNRRYYTQNELRQEAYYERKDAESGHSMRACMYCMTGLVVFLLLAACFSSCTTLKNAETETKDSVCIEYIEKIVFDTVYVTIEVPIEKQERETTDSTSFLETSFAKSTASLKWINGMPWLFHDLENKPQKIVKPVEVEKKEKIKIVYRTRYKTGYKYVEKGLTWWQKTQMIAGDILLAVIFGLLCFGGWILFRKLSII